MAQTKSGAKKTSGKAKKASKKREKVNVTSLLAEKLSDQPVGRALSAIDILYQELDNIEIRLDLLVTRVAILKKRTEALKQGDFGTLNTLLNTLGPDILAPNHQSEAASGQGDTSSDHTSLDQEIEWERLKILSETTINDVLLTADTVVALESKAAAKLVEEGVAEKTEPAEPKDDAKEEKKEAAEQKSEDS